MASSFVFLIEFFIKLWRVKYFSSTTAFNRPISIYVNSYLAPRLRGIKQRKSHRGSAGNEYFISFVLFPNPRNQLEFYYIGIGLFCKVPIMHHETWCTSHSHCGSFWILHQLVAFPPRLLSFYAVTLEGSCDRHSS